MKLHTIMCMLALYISTLSWARNLQDDEELRYDDLLDKIESLQQYNNRQRQKEEQMQATIDQLVQEASERDAEIVSLKNDHIDTLRRAVVTNQAHIEYNTDYIQRNKDKTEEIEKDILSMQQQFQSTTDIANNNKLDIEETNKNWVASDDAIWEIQTEITKVQDTLSGENRCINDYYSKTGVYCGDRTGSTLKRLPLWGKQVRDDEINFEWPTQELYDQMEPDVKIQSIEFRFLGYYIASIKVNLSNYQSSPTFDTQYRAEEWYDKTIEFDQSDSIRAVKGLSLNKGICYLKFYDSKGEMKYEYDPDNADNILGYHDPNAILEVKLEENQELIGVYGNNDGYNLGSLGFIVKEKNQ